MCCREVHSSRSAVQIVQQAQGRAQLGVRGFPGAALATSRQRDDKRKIPEMVLDSMQMGGGEIAGDRSRTLECMQWREWGRVERTSPLQVLPSSSSR